MLHHHVHSSINKPCSAVSRPSFDLFQPSSSNGSGTPTDQLLPGAGKPCSFCWIRPCLRLSAKQGPLSGPPALAAGPEGPSQPRAYCCQPFGRCNRLGKTAAVLIRQEK